MTRWSRRIRGAIGMGLTWAAGWAIVGLLIGVTSLLLPRLPWDAFFEVFDAPLPALGVPGFFGGVFFALVLGIAGRNRRFDELSLRRFAAWGAVGGVLLSLFPAALVAVGLATPREGLDMWISTAVISGPLVFLSTISATATLLVARRAQGRPSSDADLPGVPAELAGREAPELGPGTGWPLGGPESAHTPGDPVPRAGASGPERGRSA